MKDRLPYFARLFVMIWFIIGGLGHFVATDFFVRITPPWVPYPLEVVWVSGLFELAGAIGMALPAWRKAAGLGLFMLTIAVSGANVNMSLNPHLFPEFPPVLLHLRMALQVFLLGCILLGSGWWRPAFLGKADQPHTSQHSTGPQ
ncbi:MAG: DoxX family protein [Limnobacter sp.]|uniref:DoxX family protein n=1 Tax=Limnobacter sp. TaxID=2003368 RepID=UPI00391A5B3D